MINTNTRRETKTKTKENKVFVRAEKDKLWPSDHDVVARVSQNVRV